MNANQQQIMSALNGLAGAIQSLLNQCDPASSLMQSLNCPVTAQKVIDLKAAVAPFGPEFDQLSKTDGEITAVS